MPRRKNTQPIHVEPDSVSDIGLGFVVKRRKITKRNPGHMKPGTFRATIQKFGDEHVKYLIGKLNVGLSQTIFPIMWNKCKINGSTHTKSLQIKFDDSADVVVQVSTDIDFLKVLFQSKLFRFQFDVAEDTQTVSISLYLNQLPVQITKNSTMTMMKKLMVDFFNIDTSDMYESVSKVHENVDNLYEGVKNYRNNVTNELIHNIDVQHSELLPKLRPYQADAVRWMVKKEQTASLDNLHPMYFPLVLNSGITIYYNKYTGCIESDKPIVTYRISGGILADEMGLGKTVEVLACILNNPRSIETNKTELQTEETMAEFLEETPTVLDETPAVLDETDMEIIPKIETQLKYKKPKEPPPLLPKAKDVSKLSPARRAAQLWYESKLMEVRIKDKSKRDAVVEVKCICGDFNLNGVVHCQECKKMQHADCMGFKRTGPFFCSQCWFKKPLIKSKATLIVSPISISGQWTDEVRNHVRKNGIKVFEYKGIHNYSMIYPVDFADYDLVLTTYAVLQSELRFSSEHETSLTLRHSKRYNPPITPLLFVEWWRLCLDEAQTVECPTHKVSEMAHQLNAVHRWAVTGTPIQKYITDIYGLIEYLQLTPYDDFTTWKHILYEPYINGNKTPMFELLSKILWRSAKADVIEQINIPPQSVEEHLLEFSAVEKFFYKREHETCASSFLTKLNMYDTLDITLSSIDRQNLNKVLAPLLSLRKVCTHPYAVRGRYLATKRQVNSMEELLEALIKKNINECEDCMRAVIAALNGMAGILLIQNRSIQAVEKYREALLFMSEYDKQDYIKIDKLQRIHTLYNLNEVLCDKNYTTPPPTLRDEQLKAEYEAIQCKYMEKYITQTRAALNDAKAGTEAVEQTLAKLYGPEGGWCADAIDSFIEDMVERELLRKIHDLTRDDSKYAAKHKDVLDIKSVLYLITIWTDKVTKQLKKLREIFTLFENAFNTNGNYISEDIVNEAMECHLRPDKSEKNRTKAPCLCCKLNNNLQKYEILIFTMKKKNYTEESNRGSWNSCLEELILKVIYAFGKTKDCDPDLLKDGKLHLQLCELRRKEFKELRKLYTYYDAQVCAQDEVNICKIRFRLRTEKPAKELKRKLDPLKNLQYESENKYEFIHVLSEHELDFNYNILNNEKIDMETSLKNFMGTHKYLQTLKQQQYAGQSADPCPICQNQLVDTWCILLCGHCYCLDCIHNLLDQNTQFKSFQCSVCRKKQERDDISYIKLKGGTEQNEENEDGIKGSHSTKIEAVLKAVLKLRKDDAHVKILIFSKWSDVLTVLGDALNKNSIEYEFINSSKCQEKLSNFKNPNKIVTVLLLPVHLGAKGLNLIEATHVFLIEPIMNPGEELQAVGRVHRIGQTKPTTVHRFLIKNTIEENIHNAITTNTDVWDDKNLTLAQLKNLFTEIKEL